MLSLYRMKKPIVKLASPSKVKKSDKAAIKNDAPLWLVIAVCILGLIMVGYAIYNVVPFTKTELRNAEVGFQTDYIKDSTLELREEQVRQNGENGSKQETWKVTYRLNGKIIKQEKMLEQEVKAPIRKIIAQGTKRYQYMWCSNGSYRYYTNEQFQVDSVGFTHKSEDACAQNGQGHMTGLADTAPTPVYNNYTTTVPRTSIHCYDTSIGYSSSFTCY